MDDEGKPNFRYVTTHICDSIKRQVKADGARGIQGEFGIGLLSFWTVGRNITMTTAGADGKTYQMHMQKGSPNYALNVKRTQLFPESGTELTISPLLAGVRQLNGDKIQWYLASELRDRIRNSGVSIKVVDRTARKEYKVEPRQFSGRLLIRKAFKEALLALPAEEYDWFEIKERRPGRGAAPAGADEPTEMEDDAGGTPLAEPADAVPGEQKQFFEYAGPLFGIRVSPQSSVVPVGQSRTYRAVARDRSRIAIDHDLDFVWRIAEGAGGLENDRSEIATFIAPEQPGLTRIAVTVTQGAIVCEAEAIVTVTDSLLPEMREPADNRQGLPGYTFRKAPGELWRSKYDAEQNVIVINNGHRDFVFASRNRKTFTDERNVTAPLKPWKRSNPVVAWKGS